VKRALAILAGVVLVGASAGRALAQEDQVVAPPGNSGIQEYLEIVPAAGGDRPAGGGGQAARTRLDAKTAKALRRLGPDGRAAAALAAAGAPGDARGAGGAQALGSSAPSGSVATDDGGRAGAVVSALAGGGGMGLAFPLLLLGTFAAALGLLAIRRVTRRR
jgi:hypothetical protein